MRNPAIPKGQAMALHLTPAFEEGVIAQRCGQDTSANPYDYFGQYTEHYAWCIGWQRTRNGEKPT